ncbi:MOSC domain-containing protein [Pseudoduganella rivuli]|uniref:MOSC domain-containing protein n=1 Tax=Pseudoduganella rivuli TaxID=2666085 RepID=UPI001E4EAA6C|nr:MOSC domain-containing protein [Pseudoduganella rivuli]
MLTSHRSIDIGHVKALSIRRLRHEPPTLVAAAQALTGLGLAEDIHADPLSLRQLLVAGEGAYHDLELSPLALRENLLLDCDTSTLRSGSVLRVGQDVLLWLTFQCEACGHLNSHQDGLSKVIGMRRGMLARVINGGMIHVGDSVRNLGQLLPQWSDDWKERVRRVLDAVPTAEVIEYKQLARLAGVPSSYCRVFPRVTRDFGKAYASKAVSVQSKISKPRWQGTGLFELPRSTYESLEGSRQQHSRLTPTLPTICEKNMNNAPQNNFKEQIVSMLSQADTKQTQVLQLAGATVLFTKGRTLKGDMTPPSEPKPYPAVACALPDDYDSWLS